MKGAVHLFLLLGSISLRAGGATAHAPAAGDQILVVTSTGVTAYDEVLESLRKGLSQQGTHVLDLRQKDAEQILGESLRLKTVKVVITVGAEAEEAVLAQRAAAPVIATAIPPAAAAKESGSAARPVSVIPVQVPPATLIENVKRVFPGKTRLGIIRNTAFPDSGADTLKAAGEAAGFTVKIADCNGPGQLLQVFQSFKDRVDLVLCFPDASLYNSATIKPLVLASLRYRLPLVGFSEGFVRAGGVLAVYPDFHDLGARGADLVQKILNGQPVARIDYPRKFRVAINQNITRLLGLSYSQSPAAGEEFVIIR